MRCRPSATHPREPKSTRTPIQKVHASHLRSTEFVGADLVRDSHLPRWPSFEVLSSNGVENGHYVFMNFIGIQIRDQLVIVRP